MDHAGHAKIHDPYDTGWIDQDIVGLEVSMNQADGMRGLQRVRRLTIEDQNLTPGTRRGLPSRKGNPRNKLHGDEDLAMDLTHFIDLHNVGMRNTGHRLRLSQGTLGSTCGTLIPMENLERDPAIELLVIRGIDRAHATHAQLT